MSDQREPWARPDCRICGGWGFVWCLPHEAGEKYQCECGNCREASNKAETPTDPVLVIGSGR